MKTVYRFKGSPIKLSEQAEGRDEFSRLKVRLEKAAKRPAWDRGSQSMSGAPKSYLIGQQQRAFQTNRESRREQTKLDERACRQALASCERKLGPLHPETFKLLHQLADVLRKLGKVAEADHEMRVLHMRRRMRDNETSKKVQQSDTYGTGANPPMLMRKIPAKQVPQRPKMPGPGGGSTDTVPPAMAPETPKPPSQPRPQSAPSRRRPNPPRINSFGMPQSAAPGHGSSSHLKSEGGEKVAGSQGPGEEKVADSQGPGEQGTNAAKKQGRAQVRNETKPTSYHEPYHQDLYQELRARLVEQMVESCIDRVRGESQMVTLLRETRARAFQMSEELQLDPERCAEAIQKLEEDLGLQLEERDEVDRRLPIPSRDERL